MLDANDGEAELQDASFAVDDHVRCCPHPNLSNCFKSIEAGELSAVTELLEIMHSVTGAALSDESSQMNMRNNALDVLYEIRNFISSVQLEEKTMGALFYELPAAVSDLAGVSDYCSVVVDNIIDCMVAKCSPRDMLSLFCEALSFTNKKKFPFRFAAPLLTGLAKVTRCFQRRPFQQLKAVVPITLDVLKALVADNNADEMEVVNLFRRSLSIADSMQVTRENLAGVLDDKLGALLGLYVLQLVVLISFSVGPSYSLYLPLICRISTLLRYCGCSYVGLITGSDVAKFSTVKNEVEEDYMRSCFSEIRLGASLVVIWGQAFEESTQGVEENMSSVKGCICCSRIRKWQALGMLKHILLSENLKWKFKQHAIEFLLCITDRNKQNDDGDDEVIECSTDTPSLCAVLQGITSVIIHSPIATLRKNAFKALKTVLEDAPISLRLDALEILIKNSKISSMTALLLDLLRSELHKEITQGMKKTNGQVSLSWTPDILDLVEHILRPPEGGPPRLPEQADSVLAALNLFRFILMTESARKTNYTGIMLKTKLQRVNSEWLQPLRTFVTGIISENKDDETQAEVNVMCSIYPLELVLYRCIELVEEKLNQLV